MGVIRSIKTATTRVLGSVSTALGVPRAVSAAILAVGATAIPVTGSIMFSQQSEVEFETLWVGDEDECKDKILEADEGEGDVQVPESLTFHNRTEGACDGPSEIQATLGHIGSWEGHAKALNNPAYFGNGTDQRKLCQYLLENGDDSGTFSKLGDKYVVAVEAYAFAAPGNEMANIGDELTLYFDDGTSISALVGDWKGWQFEGHSEVTDPKQEDSWAYMFKEVDPQGRTGYGNGWGHGPYKQDNGVWDVCMLEFWGIDSMGDPMAGALQQDTGGNMTRLVSFTNNGMSSEFASLSSVDSSVMSGAESARQTTRNSKASNAIDECNAKGNYDNSTLTAALVSYSFSQRHEQPDSEPGTHLYQSVCEAVLGTNDDTAIYHYHSCDRGVAAAVRWTGADIEFPAGGCDAQLEYCRQHSELWEPVSGAQNVIISGGDDWAEGVGLQPGDIGMTEANGGHTLAYVGHQAIADGYDKFVKGTDGDIGEPTATSAWVMASAHERAAGMQDFSDDRSYCFFRYKGDYPDADKYADVGSMATLSSTKKGGTSCDCVICEDPNTDVGMDLAWLALVCTGTAVDLDGEILGEFNNPWLAPSLYEPTKDNAGLLNEEKIYEVTLKANGGNNAYASCAQYVSAMAAAVVDMDISGTGPMVSAGPGTVKAYLDASKYFKKAGTALSIDECQPGDIFIFGTQDAGMGHSSGHVAIFVGNDLATKMFPGTRGNVCEAGFAASGECRYPKCSEYTDGMMQSAGIDVYRPVSHNKSSQYGEVDYRSIVNWGSGPGKISTSCEEEEEPNQAYESIIEAARTQLGLPYVFGSHHTMDPNPPSLDCSGLVLWAYYQGAQIDIEGSGGINQGNPRTSGGMYDVASSGSGPWEIVDISQAVAGDVVCWPNSHVALYIDGTMDSLHVIHETYWECKEETINSGYCGGSCYILHWKG